MAIDEGLYAWIEEAMAPVGTLSHRPMMGGATLYCDGTVFAILAMDSLWFKADAASDAVWDAAGAERFSYARGGKVATINYRRAPDEAYDDADALRRWARRAIEAGARAGQEAPPARPTLSGRAPRPRPSAPRPSPSRPRSAR